MSTVEKWINKLDGSRGGTPGKRQVLQDLLVEFLLLENPAPGLFNDRQIYGYFKQLCELSPKKVRSRMFANCEMQGAFSELSSFWISFATDDPTRLGSRNYPNLEILRRGLEHIRASRNSAELDLINSEIKRTEQAHVDYQNSRYWRDLRKFNVGIQWDMTKRELVFYKKHQVYPDGESGREISPDEIRAKKWIEKDELNRKLARLEELEREITTGSSGNNSTRGSQNHTSGSKKSASSFDDLPDSLDDLPEPTLGIETAPMDEMKKPLVESICIGGPTAEIKPDSKPKKKFQIHHDPTMDISTQGMSQKIEKLPTLNLEESIDMPPCRPNKPKFQVYSDPTADIMGVGQDMSRKVDLSTLNLAPTDDIQSISQGLSCSLDLGKENIPDEPTFAFLSPKPNDKIEKLEGTTRSIKRGTEVLTPQRNQPTLKKTDRRPDEATPTYIVKQANDEIDKFFNETNVFFKHKPKAEMDTLRLSPTTTPQVTREKKNTTARLFMSPAENDDGQGVKKFDIFNDFSASSRRTSNGSNISSLSRASVGKLFCPSETLDLLRSPDELKQTESTRRIGGSMSDAIPDISIFGDETSTWQKTHHDESSVYGAPKEVDPWSETFIQMQIGQSGKCIPTEGVLLEKETVYKFQGHHYRKIRLLGEGNFAKVYVCSDISSDKLAALKVQKKGLSWEPIILSETLNRVRGSSIENAISDLYTACMFESGNGVLVTSYYKYGTLLDLCAHSRTKLVTKSPTMKPFIYFFGAQLLNLMHHLHQNGILHGDFKPDNIMLDDIQSFDEPFHNGKSQGIRLINFGRAINNRAISSEIAFTGKCYTSGFMCPQMANNQKWRYQVDLYAMAMSLHLIIFGDYAKIKFRNGHAPTQFTFPRYFDKQEWKQLFDQLMNHDGLGDQNNLLRQAADFLANEYSAIDQKEKDNFQVHYQHYTGFVTKYGKRILCD